MSKYLDIIAYSVFAPSARTLVDNVPPPARKAQSSAAEGSEPARPRSLLQVELQAEAPHLEHF